jgi:hypothetical protein
MMLRPWLRSAAALGLSSLSVLGVAAAPAAHAEQVGPKAVSVAPTPGHAGFAVAITRIAGTKLAVVGAPDLHGRAGAAYLYVQHGSAWRRQQTLTSPEKSETFFGSAVAASARFVVIGAYAAGKVYVYQRSGTTWRRQAMLVNPATSRWYGSSVAISGSTIIVGDASANAAYIYQLDKGAWSKPVALYDPRGQAYDYFGTAVALSGSTAMIGGVNEAYVYVRSASGWTQQASLDAFGQSFGTSLSLSGSTAVVGAWGAYNQQGLAYVFRRTGQAWRQVARLKAPNPVSDATFGMAVAISGPRVVVGAPSPILHTPLCGTVYEFVHSAAGWRHGATVTDPGCKPGDQFGYSVGILGQVALIGAPAKNHNAGSASEVTIP